MPDHITVLIEDLPTYRAKMGRSRDNLALKIIEKIKRPESVKSEMHVFTKGGRRLDSDADISELEADLNLSERVREIIMANEQDTMDEWAAALAEAEGR